MKLSTILPLALFAGVGAVALTANDLVTGEANAALAGQIDKKPTNRLGAQLSKDLDEGQRSVAGKAQTLDMQQRMLDAASNRMKAQAAAMPQQAQPGQTPQEEAAKKAADESIMQLVKVYQSMKPKAAAKVFERLDLDIQVAVASKMRSQAMASLMAAMTPEAATKLTTALARPEAIAVLKKQSPASPPSGMPVAPANRTPKGSPLAAR